ncbi:lantibiotic dehydratase [Nonomuraea sp. K274]|uniref:Lantibiotic dehydratase n=1 Tax=Nonomuraea cypriaca TaxID=1187855 RepID=A0A931A3F4_9ACTN|nr:lantibiotic dehydratase [Nonomuraea cypriaca]MBF8185532.1 lantibiotic dehydratase [Nonomuraea cypriaca]
MNRAVARVAGLPLSALDALACPGATELAARVVSLTDELTRRSEVLSDALYDVIGTAGAHKPALVAIRRDLHGLRRPKRTEVLPAALTDPVREWISLWEERARAREALPGVLANEARAAWDEVRDLAAAPAVRHGLAHASPDLSADLEKWLADPGRRPRAATLASLLRYVTRVAAKTSPFSTFTSVHLVEWAEGGAAWRVPDVPPTVVVEADVGLRSLVESVLPRRPELAAARVVRLSPAAYVSGEQVVFPGQDGRMRTLQRTPALDALVELLRTEEGARWDVVAAKLAGDDPSHADRVLSGLLRGGLMEATPPVPGQSLRPFATLANWTNSATLLVGPGGPLRRIQEALDRAAETLGNGDPVTAGCGGAVRGITDALPELGLPVMAPADLRRRVLRESALGAPVVCALPEWRPALADLELVRRWLAVHDPMLPLRLALADHVRDLSGPGSRTPLLVVYAAVAAAPPGSPLHPDFLEHPDPLAGAPDPRLRRLRDLRTRSIEALGQGRAAQDVLPAWVRDPGPVTCYVQPYHAEDGLRLVLNAAHGGHGRGTARWTRLLGHHPAPAPRGYLAAELPGTFGHSLNLHAPATGWELDYPGAVGQAPPERRIPLTELEVRHDPVHGVADLWWPRAGRTVVPVHGGMMSETLLPPLARLLVEGFGTTHLTHPTLPAIPRSCGPRIDLGRVTVARAQWTVNRDNVPRRGTDDAGHLVDLHAWARRTGIPRRCFVRVRERQVSRDRLAFDRRRKPVFVDFGAWPSVLEFGRLVERAPGDLEVTEALPDGDQAVELAIEVGDR